MRAWVPAFAGMAAPATLRPGIVLILAVLMLAVSPASAQRRPLIKRRPGIFRPAPRLENNEARERARLLIARFLKDGMRRPHMGEQVTTLYADRVHESRQVYKYMGPARWRMEYLSPPDMRNEVILVIAGRMFHYKPAENRIHEGMAPQDLLLKHIQERLQDIKQGGIRVAAVGQELIAGRQAAIVEVRPPRPNAPYVRLWIDEETGIRLKHEFRDAQDRVRSSTYFTKVELDPQFTPGDFMPNSLPPVPHVPLLPDSPPLPDVASAQRQVGYTIREPAVPSGYRLYGIWVVAGPGKGTATVLHYSDGVNSFAIFETAAPLRQQRALPKLQPRRGAAHWVSDGVAFSLIGAIRPETMKQIVDSLQ